ncbi:MAG: dUTP diphosphatase [Candidatus Thermoplasmatota archaeon]|jgi:dUTP pyrophosphatase|nr:dUTP diphosphatase [Candidatus Thermoplasmatota archaeon]MCL5984121.1 dUTP diphosphatase [Candidatus Thermoplasmatota archaeon]
MPKSKVVLIDKVDGTGSATLPFKATDESACFDLHSSEDTTLLPGKVTLVRTGLKMRPPEGTFIEVRPRSGLSSKGVLMVNAPGTIDRDYDREVMVPLTLLFGDSYQIRSGDRIAQIRIVENHGTDLQWGTVASTGNRKGGFGSTGR